ncbi:MAG: type II secretion system F family protein [Firmicutes bacterium]|nr:type II secretion system F family protein [Bacillota bacterium]
MPLFSYQAYDKDGVLINGKLEAENEFAAAAYLKKQGCTPLEISTQISLPPLLKGRKKVSLGELALLSRQMGTLLAAGIPLRRSLLALVQQVENMSLQSCLLEIAQNVEAGSSFSQALEGFPQIFSPVYVSLIRAGEVGGTLELVLQQLGRQLEREKALKDNIRSAMFYPLTVLLFSFFVLIVILIYVVPVVEAFYPSGTELSNLVSAIIALSNSVRHYWYYYFAAVVIFGWAVRKLKKSAIGKKTGEYINLRLPVWGGIIKKTFTARFARTLAMLLFNGVPVLQAMEATGPAVGSLEIEKITRWACERVKGGDSIAVSLGESGFFPQAVIVMIAVGEEAGNLPKMLEYIADYYEAEVTALVKGLTSLVEPLLIIGVGGIVGLMVLALYLPMLSLILQF